MPGEVEYKNFGIYPVIGTQTAATGSWTGIIDAPQLYDGLTIAYYLPYAGSGNATLNLTLSDGSTTGAVNCYYTNNSRLTTHYGAGSVIILTYFSAGSISVTGTDTTEDRWLHCDYNTNTVPSGYCSTAAGTAAKVATCSEYSLLSNSYLPIIMTNSNTSASALTLNINSKGAKPIYINGAASSATNYTLPAGPYLIYYNGTNYYFNTDGKLPILYNGTMTTVQNVATNLSTVIANLATVATSGSYTDLSNKPTKLSNFTDDLGSSPTHTHSQYLASSKEKRLCLYSGTIIQTVSLTADAEPTAYTFTFGSNNRILMATVTEAWPTSSWINAVVTVSRITINNNVVTVYLTTDQTQNYNINVTGIYYTV